MRQNHSHAQRGGVRATDCESYCWSIDSMKDVLSSGQTFRTLNVIVDYNRAALLISASYALPSAWVTELIDKIAKKKWLPTND